MEGLTQRLAQKSCYYYFLPPTVPGILACEPDRVGRQHLETEPALLCRRATPACIKAANVKFAL